MPRKKKNNFGNVDFSKMRGKVLHTEKASITRLDFENALQFDIRITMIVAKMVEGIAVIYPNSPHRQTRRLSDGGTCASVMIEVYQAYGLTP